ncbi:MAG TPA: carbohydrate ABC transporter permease [Rectinemataceae bacterium]|nr:carbohydrate ABC transporter permease [Rectinemataceae bacterium]
MNKGNPSRRARLASALGSGATYILLLLGLIVFAGPFLWMLATSFKIPAEQFSKSLLPHPFTLVNYERLFTSARFLWLQVFNSFQVSILSTIGQILSCSMAAFVLSLYRFRGRALLFALILAGLVIPAQVTLIPNFILFSKLGLVGTKVPLWITSFLGGAFGTFLLRQYFSALPGELAEAARVDGASLPRIFFTIYLPMAKPALAGLAILTFTGSWNELTRPLIYLPSNQRLTTLTVGLSLYQAQYAGQWSFLMACAVVSVLPILLIFLVAQRRIIEGSAITGLK